MTRYECPSRPPSKPSPDKHRSHHVTRRSRDSPSNRHKGKNPPGQLSHQEHYVLVHRHYIQYRATRLQAASPWPIKGGGSRPAMGIHIHIHVCPHTTLIPPNIGTLPQSSWQGLGGFSSSPALLLAPLYRHPRSESI
jgi:hypothetical protein